MEPKIVKKDEFNVVGVKLRCKMGETSDIPKLWGQLMGRMGDIEHLVGDGYSYGITTNYDEATDMFDYVAAFKVSKAQDAPEGMVSLAIPAQTYAVFPCTMPTIGETYDMIYKEWLPQSDYEHAYTSEYELYPPTFNPDDPDSQFEIYIPVKK